MNIEHVEIGVCGLSCRLCPSFHTHAKSRCGGCKSDYRMAAGCPFITCAIKKNGIEFCWDCAESESCERWRKHRNLGQHRDSFKCYQTLETDIAYIQQHGIDSFINEQQKRASILLEMLQDFNEGRSKSYYCIAATVMKIEELENALSLAKVQMNDQNTDNIKTISKILRSVLDDVANKNNYLLKLRK